RALGHDVVLQVPVRDRRLQQGLAQGEPGIVDHQVEAAERQYRGVNGCLYLRLIGDVGLQADGDVGVSDLCCRGLGFGQVEVGDDDAGAFSCEASGDGFAD